ncbi:MAG: DeoR/GlpR family DNA-binding transcription regulator [Limisphaerales bacterium]
MTANARWQTIEARVQREGECSVERLARECAVSEMTIRRDLAALARSGRIVRTHGGAALGTRILFEFGFLQRARENDRAKESIGRTAAALVPEGSTVMMDSGTTTLALAHALQHHAKLTVVTTSLPVASALQHAPGVSVLLLGGFVRRDSPDLAGALTESNLEILRADLAFLGSDGIDLQGNLYNQSPEVARMLGKMAAAAGSVYVVADHSKIGRTALVRFGNITHWQGLITDEGLPQTQGTALRRSGVNVILATHEPTVAPP